MSGRGWFSWVLVCWLVAGCAETGGERFDVPLSARGTERTSFEKGAAVFRLTRADVAVGPLYFCASESAELELCEAAIAEFLEARVLNGLDPGVRELGELAGTSGEIRSALYDYGVTWLLTQQAPRPDPGVEHSAILEGTLTQAGRELRFTARVDVLPRTRGSNAVHGQPTREQLGENDRLTLAIDPYAWLAAIDVDALFALDPELTGQVEIERGSQAYEAILQGMQNRAPVRFEWE